MDNQKLRSIIADELALDPEQYVAAGALRKAGAWYEILDVAKIPMKVIGMASACKCAKGSNAISHIKFSKMSAKTRREFENFLKA